MLGKSKEAEEKRINKELANIRSKFKGKIGELIITHTHTLTHTHTQSHSHTYSKTCSQTYHSFSTHLVSVESGLSLRINCLYMYSRCTVNTSMYKKTVFHV